MPATSARDTAARLQSRLDEFQHEHGDLVEAYRLLGLVVEEQAQGEVAGTRTVIYQSDGTDPSDQPATAAS